MAFIVTGPLGAAMAKSRAATVPVRTVLAKFWGFNGSAIAAFSRPPATTCRPATKTSEVLTSSSEDNSWKSAMKPGAIAPKSRRP